MAAAVTGADLAARVTAAAAARADFERERRAFATGGQPRPEWADWAVRLSVTVGQLLAGIGDPAAPGPARATLAPIVTTVDGDGCGLVAAADLPIVRSALEDAARCHEGHRGTPGVGAVYRGIGRALGGGS